MAVNLLIPKIEWNFLEKTGDTHTSTTIDDIASTTDIIVGMYVTGYGIPSGTTVVSKDASSVVISAATTRTAGDTALTFFQRFNFTYPPSSDTDTQLVPQAKTTVSLSGINQVQVDFIEERRDVVFGFITNAQYLILREDFYIPWAVYGYSFRYYPDQDDDGSDTLVTEDGDTITTEDGDSIVTDTDGSTTYDVFQLSDLKLSRKRQVKKHPSFLYELGFKMRRVL